VGDGSLLIMLDSACNLGWYQFGICHSKFQWSWQVIFNKVESCAI